MLHLHATSEQPFSLHIAMATSFSLRITMGTLMLSNKSKNKASINFKLCSS